MLFHLRRGLVLLTLSVCASGCDVVGLGDGGEGELERNRERWVALSVTSYEYVVSRRCLCPPSFLGPVRVRVEDGVVTQRTYVNPGDPIPGEPGEAFPSVDGLFDALADAYERDAHSVEVTYDPETGVPLDIYIDYEENTADEELGFEVSTLPVSLP